jgi:hypothetical protein
VNGDDDPVDLVDIGNVLAEVVEALTALRVEVIALGDEVASLAAAVYASAPD